MRKSSHVGNLCSIFWIDFGSHYDYKLFGDVLIFNTKYKINNYNLVLGLFCEGNHHKNTIIFGINFQFCEIASSFEWLFDELLRRMGWEPLTIIMDRDPSMKLAISSKMPDTTFHRLCKGHITHKMGG